jgi:hypothetical protein
VFCDPPRAEWDFRDVPYVELGNDCIWEAARESKALMRDPSRLDVLPFSPGVGWLLFLREIFEEDFLCRPWMQARLEYPHRLHQKYEDIGSTCFFYGLQEFCYPCRISDARVIVVQGQPAPGDERRGCEKATQWRAWLRKIGVRRLRSAGLTFGQIAKLYQHVGIVGLDWAPVDEKRPEPAATTFEQIIQRDTIEARRLSLKRVLQRDAAEANGILKALLPSVFALGQAEKTGTSKFRATGILRPDDSDTEERWDDSDAMIELWMDDN